MSWHEEESVFLGPSGPFLASIYTNNDDEFVSEPVTYNDPSTQQFFCDNSLLSQSPVETIDFLAPREQFLDNFLDFNAFLSVNNPLELIELDEIEPAAIISDHKYADLKPLQQNHVTYNNQQEVFNEIYRECQQFQVGSSSEDSTSFESTPPPHDFNDSTFHSSVTPPSLKKSIKRKKPVAVETEESDDDDDCEDATSCDDETRKKSQNRKAASKYRSKRKMQREKIEVELKHLQAENERLKTQVDDAEREIGYLKGFLEQIGEKAKIR